MFVAQRVFVASSYAHVSRALSDPAMGLGLLAGGAYRSGEELSVRIGVGGDPPRLAKTVSVRVGAPIRGRSHTSVPLSWRAAGPLGVLYPKMEADLVARPSDGGTVLEFRGRYQPPADAVGALIDRAALNRIAEATVSNFLDRLVQRLPEDEAV